MIKKFYYSEYYSNFIISFQMSIYSEKLKFINL